MSTLNRTKKSSHALFGGLLAGMSLVFLTFTPAQAAGRCAFESKQLQFRGSPVEQASCLLRQVRKWGKVDEAATAMPAALADIIGQPTGDLKERLHAFITAVGVDEKSVGGPLNGPLSRANAGEASAPLARYFVIHDTSSPWLGDATFPEEDSPSVNSFSSYASSEPAAHIFINRLGKSMLGHDFSVPWRATKLENKAIGTPAKGLFLHIELVQPRRRDPSGGPKNDAIAPQPGFTPAQYDQLALVYVAASARRGEWLIPAYHAAIDEGLNDAHDDPQNFELGRFADAVKKLRDQLSR